MERHVNEKKIYNTNFSSIRSHEYDGSHLTFSYMNLSYPVELKSDIYGKISRIDNVIDAISKKLDIEKAMLLKTNQQFINAKEEVENLLKRKMNYKI